MCCFLVKFILLLLLLLRLEGFTSISVPLHFQKLHQRRQAKLGHQLAAAGEGQGVVEGRGGGTCEDLRERTQVHIAQTTSTNSQDDETLTNSSSHHVAICECKIRSSISSISSILPFLHFFMFRFMYFILLSSLTIMNIS